MVRVDAGNEAQDSDQQIDNPENQRECSDHCFNPHEKRCSNRIYLNPPALFVHQHTNGSFISYFINDAHKIKLFSVCLTDALGLSEKTTETDGCKLTN
jgi:hypothetical protein